MRPLHRRSRHRYRPPLHAPLAARSGGRGLSPVRLADHRQRRGSSVVMAYKQTKEDRNLRIAIIGTGAMGSVYAGLLADAGLDVYAVDVWAEHIEAINRDGLRVSGASGERVAKLRATTSAGDAGPADLAIVATKASGVEAAANAAREILSPNGIVLTIQNGLGSAERVAGIV